MSVGPSVTPYYGLNPAYKIYYVGAEDGLVEDHETWYMDLAEANLHPGIIGECNGVHVV